MRDVVDEARFRLGSIYDDRIIISDQYDHFTITKNDIQIVKHNKSSASRNSVMQKRGPSYERLAILQRGLQTHESEHTMTISFPGKDCPRQRESDGYIFTHARERDCRNAGLIIDHWFNFKNSTHETRSEKASQIPFASKKSVAVWRGKSTGRGDVNHHSNKVSRPEFCDHFHDSKTIDSKIVTHYGSEHALKMYQQAAEYKYLIFLEGNDTASSIYWTFHNQNITLMPEKRDWCSAWDVYLKPWVHYVPFSFTSTNGDVSTDIEEKIQWCESNPQECLNIIQQANQLSNDMLCEEKEMSVLREMIGKYNKHILV